MLFTGCHKGERKKIKKKKLCGKRGQTGLLHVCMQGCLCVSGTYGHVQMRIRPIGWDLVKQCNGTTKSKRKKGFVGWPNYTDSPYLHWRKRISKRHGKAQTRWLHCS